MGNPVVHFEVVGKDRGTLESFYTQLFDWKLNEVGGPMEYATIETGGDGGIGGGIGAAPDGGSGHVTFYVQVDDVQAALDKAESLGGSAVGPPMEIPGGGTIAVFTDPEGHLIGLWKGQE
jgi:uncharacterized protein